MRKRIEAFFAWLREGTRDAILSGVDDAIEVTTGTRPEPLKLEGPKKPRGKKS